MPTLQHRSTTLQYVRLGLLAVLVAVTVAVTASAVRMLAYHLSFPANKDTGKMAPFNHLEKLFLFLARRYASDELIVADVTRCNVMYRLYRYRYASVI